MYDLSNEDNEGEEAQTVLLLAGTGACRRAELHDRIDKGITHLGPMSKFIALLPHSCAARLRGGSHHSALVCGKTGVRPVLSVVFFTCFPHRVELHVMPDS